MRIALWADMEGMSGVTDHRQCWPAFEQYWEFGREIFTDEVIAAAIGLADGGAHEVFVVNAHGLGWPNVLWERMPDGVGPADDAAFAGGFDAAFHVGFHARAGTHEGFMSHTMVPGLKVATDGSPLTECHIWAWLDGVPLLGVAGDFALRGQLDGFLSAIPFLPVKHASSRGAAIPVHAGRGDRLAALTDFARHCARTTVTPLVLPKEFTFSVALDPVLAATIDGVQGLRLEANGVLSKPAENFARDAYPALQAAMGASLTPFFDAQGDLDLSSATSLARQPRADVERVCGFLQGWADRQESAWPQAT